MRASVVFPQPDSPTIPSVSPRSSDKAHAIHSQRAPRRLCERAARKRNTIFSARAPPEEFRSASLDFLGGDLNSGIDHVQAVLRARLASSAGAKRG